MKIIPVRGPGEDKPSPGPRKPGKREAIISRKTTEVITECGCCVLPGAIIGLGQNTEAECDKHGWQKIVRRATLREVSPWIPAPLLTEEPPF